MSTEHVVRHGECISSIADRHGLFWQTVWSANPKLKETRADPNRLAPGDVVIIPDRQAKHESCACDQRHRFKRKGTPAKLKIVLEEDGVPLKNAAYLLRVDGEPPREGRTDGTGLLDEWISPGAERAVLEVGDVVYELDLGGMNPIDDLIGVQSRLQNLGFYSGGLDGLIGPLTRAAVREFRSLVQLPEGEDIDAPFLRELAAWADKEHAPRYSDAAAPEVAEVHDAAHDDELQKGDRAAGRESDDDDRELAPAAEE
jgi:N-acetylmuramoyl-L-alanine amidase